MSSPAKKAKTADSKEEEKKDVEMAEAPEPPKEHETDQKADSKPKIKEAVTFLTADTTVNVAISSFGNMLMPLSEGGLNNLIAGARANVGVKSGRHMFEAKIIEQMSFQGDGGQGSKNIFRIGFSTAGSAPLLGEEGSVCFDADGFFFNEKGKSATGKRFGKDTIVAVVLNLEEKHPNINTVSLFIGGERATQPLPLPDSMKGKALYPTVSFKNCTVHYSFGPSPISPLPFKCKMIADATIKDALVTKYDKPADGACEVLFPVGLPEEGAYDWLDLFLTKNSSYTEISNRAVVAWALKSGFSPSGKGGEQASKDRPSTGFGVPSLDNFLIKDAIMMAAVLQPRNLVVMDLKGSLVKEERESLVSKFSGNPAFKVVAHLIVGEPTPDFKKKTNEIVLKEKQEKSDREFKAKQAEEKRQKALEKKKKEDEKKRAKIAKEQKKKMEAAKKIKEAAQKKKAKEIEKAKKVAAAKAKAKAEGKEYVPVEEVDEEEEKEEEKKEEEEEPEEVEEEEAEEDAVEIVEDPPKVSLTPDEKAIWFYKGKQPDISSYTLSTSFTSFTIPDKEDGFAEIRCEWAKPASKCASYLKEWILAKKQTTRVEDLKPSQWFNEKSRNWTTALQKWKEAHNAYKNMLAKKVADKLAKDKKKLAAKQAAEKKAAAAKAQAKIAEARKEMKKKQDEEKRAKGEKVEEEKEEEEKKEEEKEEPMEVEEEEEEEKEPEVDFENVDIFGVEDICDIGGKMPLFKEFQFEDWTLLGLKYELSLLVHAFRKDVDDPERTGIHLDHLSFYYNKYYKKTLDTKFYGVDSVKELLDLVDDSVYIKGTIVQTQLPEEMESLGGIVKATEEARRYRNLLIDMGKEEAKLKIKSPQQSGGGQKRAWDGEKKQGGGGGGGGGWGGGMGGWGGWKKW